MQSTIILHPDTSGGKKVKTEQALTCTMGTYCNKFPPTAIECKKILCKNPSFRIAKKKKKRPECVAAYGFWGHGLR